MNRVKNRRRWVLLNPGPVNVTERVRSALLRPDICHREKEFSNLLRDVRHKILKIFGLIKTHTVVIFSGSGTTALEGMLSSYSGKNKKILVLSNGVYGERIKKILEIHESPFLCLESEVASFPEIKKIEQALKNDSSIKAVAMVHHETSTGMLNPIDAVGALAKKYRKTFLVDAISSLGAESIHFKRAGIDFLCGTSGKCLHGFPGISFVLVSKKEALRLKENSPQTLCMDLSLTLKEEENNDTPFTPAVQVLYAFNEALDELAEEGLKNRIRNYAKKSSLIEKGFTDLNIRFLVQKEHRSHVLTSFWTPDFIRYESLHEKLKKKGFIIYAGQSKLKGKIFRVSNLGDVKEKDLRNFISSFKKIIAIQKDVAP